MLSSVTSLYFWSFFLTKNGTVGTSFPVIDNVGHVSRDARWIVGEYKSSVSLEATGNGNANGITLC